MLLVKTELRDSPIHGLGVFAAQDILKGTLVCMWHGWCDLEFTPDRIAYLKTYNPSFLEFLNHFGYKEGLWKLNGDNARFLNHSDDPNLLSTLTDVDLAKRDIKAGEELTVDYFMFDECAKEKLDKRS